MLPERVLRVGSIIFICILAFVVGYSIGSDFKDCRPVWLKKTSDMTNNIPDRVPLDNIHLFKNKVVIEGEYQLSEFSDTNSMLPTLDTGSNGITIPVYPDTLIKRGDIVSYIVDGNNYSIVHRIVDIREDAIGVYYVAQGDYLKEPDPVRIRHNQIQRITVGVVW